MQSLEDKIYEAIDGADFIDAATALTYVLANIAFNKSGGDSQAVRDLFRRISDVPPEFDSDERLH
jgi:hypothetical protein